ncbi:origin of replication complex subunit 5 [Ricinus communis]|uniref:origin of replication complex subunit 5 n=1 Tax=Ricinus communis TaxID=3988 RepID=UPI0007722ADB|nr:origin of replication complex subunit 5 [Ricinus communis]|eukprot:XP_015582944.1 origin of replication complex subunit 5 [Ricinus communis]
MGKEDNNSPQFTRMTTRTRSSSSAPATTGNDIGRTKISESYTPTLNDLVFRGERINFGDLLSSFPARKVQISELLRLLGPLNSPMLPLFLYGASSTGKTSIVLQIFRHLNRPFVYVSCRTCYSPRILFESILNQLLFHSKNSANGYSSSKRCEKPSDFVNFLHDALGSIIDELKGNSGKLPYGNMLYLIFDNLELVRTWDKSSTMLPFLFCLYDLLKMPEVGLIYISNTSPDTFYSNLGFIEPIPVYFPEYTEEDIRQIFLRNQENRKLYSCFLDVVLKPFCRTTRRMDELSTGFTSLFRKYCEPLRDLEHVPNEEMKRRLFSRFQPHIASSLNEVFSVPSQTSVEVESNKEEKHKCRKRNPEGEADFAEVDFHMSTSAKYLLISAFLASRNPATLDASLFDSTGGSDNCKRKRKASEKSMEQKEAAEQELLMKGPGTFPLERLLAIYQCISSAADDLLDEEEHGNDVLRVQGGDSGLVSDVLMQLASLCNANFIIKGGSCPLEGSTRYRSTVSEDLALKVARSLRFPLPNYMYRR